MSEELKALADQLNAVEGNSVISEAVAKEIASALRRLAAAGEQKPVACIKLRETEIQSRHDRVQWAEGLIRQLPESHDGRNSWLLNYAGEKHKADICAAPPIPQPAPGWDEAIEAALIEIVAATRKWGNPTGSAYEQGIQDHGNRCLSVVKELRSKPTATVATVADRATLERIIYERGRWKDVAEKQASWEKLWAEASSKVDQLTDALHDIATDIREHGDDSDGIIYRMQDRAKAALTNQPLAVDSNASVEARLREAPYNIKAIATVISLSYGEDPEADAPLGRICTADNEPLPCWMAYEEQAKALFVWFNEVLESLSAHPASDCARDVDPIEQHLTERNRKDTLARAGIPSDRTDDVKCEACFGTGRHMGRFSMMNDPDCTYCRGKGKVRP